MSDTLRPGMNWTPYRRADGSIDLKSAFLDANPSWKASWRSSIEFLGLVESNQPIHSSESAAIALALAESGIFERDDS